MYSALFYEYKDHGVDAENAFQLLNPRPPGASFCNKLEEDTAGCLAISCCFDQLMGTGNDYGDHSVHVNPSAAQLKVQCYAEFSRLSAKSGDCHSPSKGGIHYQTDGQHLPGKRAITLVAVTSSRQGNIDRLIAAISCRWGFIPQPRCGRTDRFALPQFKVSGWGALFAGSR